MACGQPQCVEHFLRPTGGGLLHAENHAEADPSRAVGLDRQVLNQGAEVVGAPPALPRKRLSGEQG